MIECIPNFSEGRRPEVIAAIARVIRVVPGVFVLDTHSDADHNRSVITFVGEAEAVAEAAFRAVEAAALLIDMDDHQGQHPRIGATDVLPFVPIGGATMQQCIEIARAVGARIAESLDIPVYLYGEAAARSERRDLPYVRRGGYEGLRDDILHDPERAPDFGPAQLGSAGATAVGARLPLIAYNLFLTTSDASIAKRVAKAVRGSSGGLSGVRALGMSVNGRAQVSMNLTDYRATPVYRAVEMVAREAAAYGVHIAEGELVGLIPEDALVDTAKRVLYLHGLRANQILERRIAQVIEEVTGGARRGTGPLVEQRSNGQNQQDSLDRSLRIQLDLMWRASVEALALATYDVSQITANNRVRAMLQVLARELRELAQQEQQTEAPLRSQALVLIARRAVKASEVLSVSGNGISSTTRIPLIAHLAHSVANGARLRAEGLVPELDSAQQGALVEELSAYVYRARELLNRLDVVV